MEVLNNRKASFWTEEKGDATLLFLMNVIFSFMVILINDRVVTMELFLLSLHIKLLTYSNKSLLPSLIPRLLYPSNYYYLIQLQRC
ncbi:hypothetical protein EB796_020168 [Bugula neritina]|uniref:Uncharacterized protein n=1 Tax=Bugula neritina TaxID=10212 RepID=A0A7J7J7I9_BUGNE|nr:hypothetical protein EB796_020168 [Bugula neritina]